MFLIRLWHYKLIPILDRQRLLGQHRECCALRGKGWGRKHSTVNYVFNYNYLVLVTYHFIVIEEMRKRKYKVDSSWTLAGYRGKKLGWTFVNPLNNHQMISLTMRPYPEHNDEYLKECQKLLLSKNFDYYSKYFL